MNSSKDNKSIIYIISMIQQFPLNIFSDLIKKWYVNKDIDLTDCFTSWRANAEFTLKAAAEPQELKRNHDDENAIAVPAVCTQDTENYYGLSHNSYSYSGPWHCDEGIYSTNVNTIGDILVASC